MTGIGDMSTVVVVVRLKVLVEAEGNCVFLNVNGWGQPRG
jgi:hypothetical protein